MKMKIETIIEAPASASSDVMEGTNVATSPASSTGMQYAKAGVKFPLPHRVTSAKRGQKALSSRTFTTVRPTTFFG